MFNATWLAEQTSPRIVKCIRPWWLVSGYIAMFPAQKNMLIFVSLMHGHLVLQLTMVQPTCLQSTGWSVEACLRYCVVLRNQCRMAMIPLLHLSPPNPQHGHGEHAKQPRQLNNMTLSVRIPCSSHLTSNGCITYIHTCTHTCHIVTAVASNHQTGSYDSFIL